MNIAPRYRLPVAILASVAVVAAVLTAVIVTRGDGLQNASPSPRPTVEASTDPTTTPEGAVRAMFEAFAEARPTNDASLVLPFVTSEDSPAYLSVLSFLEGQEGLGRAAVITEQHLDNLSVEIADAEATVTFTYTETGYLIDAETTEPLGSPAATEPMRVTARVVKQGSEWRVEEYESR